MPSPPPAPSAAHAPSDFRPLRRLGTGAYADVVEAEPAQAGAGPAVALKIVDKRHAVRSGAVAALRAERATLDAVRGTPGVAHLLFTYQTDDDIVFGLELVPGGELLAQIQAARARGAAGLPEPTAKSYAADVVLTLAGLRAAGVVHRDIKPENLVLGRDGHAVLVDFGSAAFVDPAADAAARAGPAGAAAADHPLSMGRRAAALPGTADYIAPEALGGGGGGATSSSDDETDAPAPAHPHAADVWALGCVVFQMLTGAPPFRGDTEYLTLQNVAAGTFSWPADAPASPAARAFVEACLMVNPAARLGSVDADDIKHHAWFQGVDWGAHLASPGPPYDPPPPPPPDDDELEWGLAAATAALAIGGGREPLTYRHNGGGGGGAVGGGVHAVSAETAAEVAKGGVGRVE